MKDIVVREMLMSLPPRQGLGCRFVDAKTLVPREFDGCNRPEPCDDGYYEYLHWYLRANSPT
ncbi:hypothetical protein HOE425_290085 [Hoeflea sp. EC-HK425]|nr:hypothetical protein HOE425_290085 [Hoeflea sp. EC-HK425]